MSRQCRVREQVLSQTGSFLFKAMSRGDSQRSFYWPRAPWPCSGAPQGLPAAQVRELAPPQSKLNCFLAFPLPGRAQSSATLLRPVGVTSQQDSEFVSLLSIAGEKHVRRSLARQGPVTAPSGSSISLLQKTVWSFHSESELAVVQEFLRVCEH